jgi:hypothetical protein
VKILDETRPLRVVELHLTQGEAQQVVAAVAECRDDLANGIPVGHAPVGDGEHDVSIYVYATEEELEAEVADRMNADS